MRCFGSRRKDRGQDRGWPEHDTPVSDGAPEPSRAGVKTVVLTHLPATGNPKDDYKRFAEEVKKQFSGPVLTANDLMEF
jgi:ribonuclease BN (tRNA processing enzyme)